MNKIAIGIFVVLVVGLLAFVLSNSKEEQSYTESAISMDTSGTTIVKLSSTDSGDYVPKVIKAKVGTKIRIEGDPNTLVGGMDTIIIDGYDLRKKISANDNVIEFTADKAGEFDMYCANGMGNGKLIVE
jgi:plastocyanin domain-containing protein